MTPDGSAQQGAFTLGQRLLLACVLLLSLALLLPYRDYLTDDTFIHLQFARHVATGRGFSFNAGEPTYGATSPLWVGLLAAAGRAGVPVDAPGNAAAMPALAAAAKALGAAFALLSVWLIVLVARRLGLPPSLSIAAGAMLGLHAWACRWAISGMETPLATACVLTSLLLLERARRAPPSATATWALLGASLGLGPLARPELHLFALLGVAAAGFGAPARRARTALVTALGYTAVTASWMALAWNWFHRVLPNTAAAKAGAWLDVSRAVDSLAAAARIVLSTEAVPLALVSIALALGVAELRGASRERRVFVALLAGWPPALVLALAGAGTQMVSRYLLPATPCVLLLGVLALAAVAPRAAPRRPALAVALALLLYAAPNLYLTARVAAPNAIEHSRGLRGSLVEIGLWARRNTPPDAVFALPDIGAFAYYADRRVLDLFGLVSPAMAPVMVREGYDAVVERVLFEREGRPRYLIDRGRTENRLTGPGAEPGPYRFLFSRTIPNLGITRPAQYVYSVYEIDWQAWDALRVGAVAKRSVERGGSPVYACRHGRAAGIRRL